jgi:hypothetical protein
MPRKYVKRTYIGHFEHSVRVIGHKELPGFQCVHLNKQAGELSGYGNAL